MNRRINIADNVKRIDSCSKGDEEVDDDCSVVSEVRDFETDKEEVGNATDNS